MQIIYNFETTRLRVKEWHAFIKDSFPFQSLAHIVKDILTPNVTESLPPHWQGSYTIDRARNWIIERDLEGVTLLIVEKKIITPLGLVILYDTTTEDNYAELRLGYLLKESAWGKGLGSELVKGLVEFCRTQPVSSITGGVAQDNIASKCVLEKNGFNSDPATLGDEEELYQLRFGPDNVS